MPRRSEADPLAAAIGARLRGFREARGWKLEEVAFQGGLASKGHLSDIEHGRVIPTVRTLQSLADHLEVDLVDLVTFPERGGRHALIQASRHVDAPTLERWLLEASRAPSQGPSPGSAPLRDRADAPRIVKGPRPRGAFVPLLDLQAAGGPFPDPRSVSASAWVGVDALSAALPGAFAARVLGTSMEPRVPDGSLCLFRRPGPGNRTGRVFLVELRETASPEDGGAYVLKLLERASQRGRELIRLRSLHPDFPPLLLDPRKQDLRVIAELVRVLG